MTREGDRLARATVLAAVVIAAVQRETFPTAQVYVIGADGTGLRVVADTLSGHPAW